MVKFDSILSLMTEKGISAKELSSKTGISTGNISDWKSGRSMPKTDALIKIASCLEVSIDYIINGCSKYMSELHEFLGKDKYYIRCIDGEDCICRKINNYEIELSNCKRKAMKVNLYLWELSDKGEPLHIVGNLHDIKTKSELKDKIDYIADNINNIESVVDNGFFSHNSQSFTTGDVTNNSGVIGQINAPTTIKNENDVVLSTQENDLLQIYREADGKTQMKIMQFVYSLENKGE